jgi:hypothetical protein
MKKISHVRPLDRKINSEKQPGMENLLDES